MLVLRFAVITFFLCRIVIADEVTTIKTEPGKLVRLEAVEPAVLSQWMLANGPDDCFAVSETGKMCYFATPSSGKYVFMLAYTTPEQTLKTKKFVVEVVTTEPVRLPDGKYKLAQLAYDSCKKLNKDDKDTVSKIAKNYAMIKLQAENKAFTEPQAMINATRIGNQQACSGQDTDRYLRIIFAPQMEAMKALKLTTIEDHMTAWGELAVGYEAWVRE